MFFLKFYFQEVNLTDGVLTVNGEVIEFPELPNPEALTAADIEVSWEKNIV